MKSFEFNLQTRFVIGVGAVERLGELVRAYGGERALLISDPGLAAAGHVERAAATIRRAGAECFVFLGVEENPTTRHVDRAVAAGREHGIDLLVGLGGGSAMDTAKGANFILSCGGRMQDYAGVGKATGPMLPMIAVPTTAGTGSEAQSFALIADEATHMKMACGDKRAACRAAVLDPALTLSQPREVAALTGIDAASHALESYVTTRRNPLSQLFSREAWRLIARSYPRIFEAPEDLEARGGMLWGAALAGLAIEHSMLGATHSCANPLTARFGLAHGRAIGIMLPHVIRANAGAVAGLYLELLTEIHRNGASAATAGEVLAALVEELQAVGELPRTLSECGVERRALPELAGQAAAQWTAQFNPRPLDEADFLGLYERAWG